MVISRSLTGKLTFLLTTLCVIPTATAQSDNTDGKKIVAVLIFDGVELLDFAGPAEVFIVAGQRHPFRVITVSPTGQQVTTMGGIKVKPDCSVAKAPSANVVVLPGGNTRSVTKETIDWIRKSSESASVVMSVCYGAFLLADAGLLEGVTATTHSWALDSLRRSAPKCNVVGNRRFVDSGKILTTAGVTAGIDGALHIVTRLAGSDVSKWTAESWMEYRYQAPAGFGSDGNSLNTSHTSSKSPKKRL